MNITIEDVQDILNLRFPDEDIEIGLEGYNGYSVIVTHLLLDFGTDNWNGDSIWFMSEPIICGNVGHPKWDEWDNPDNRKMDMTSLKCLIKGLQQAIDCKTTGEYNKLP